MKKLLSSCLLLLPVSASACAVCFGAPDHPMTRGAGFAIWTMLGVTYLVIFGMLAMFVGIGVRARRAGASGKEGA